MKRIITLLSCLLLFTATIKASGGADWFRELAGSTHDNIIASSGHFTRLIGENQDRLKLLRDGKTILQIACINGNPALVDRLLIKELVQKGKIDPNCPSLEGKTALDYANEFAAVGVPYGDLRKKAMIRRLRKAGAKTAAEVGYENSLRYKAKRCIQRFPWKSAVALATGATAVYNRKKISKLAKPAWDKIVKIAAPWLEKLAQKAVEAAAQ